MKRFKTHPWKYIPRRHLILYQEWIFWFFSQQVSEDKFLKKSFSDNTEWTKHGFEGRCDKEALKGVQKPHSLQAPAGRRLEPPTAAAALAPAQCSHRALITRLHGVQMDPLQAYVPHVKGSVLLHSTISFPHPVPFYKEEPDLFCFLLPYVHL